VSTASSAKTAGVKPQWVGEQARSPLPKTSCDTTFQKRVWSIANILPGQVGLRNESARVRWIAEVLGQVARGSRILDAGCGEQQFRKFCSHLIYVGQDFAEYNGKGDGVGLQTETWDHQTNVPDLVCDITAIPEANGSFDAILCTEVLEHVPNPVEALCEFSRLLKPGGVLLLTAPFCSIAHFTPYYFSTGFSSYWYETHLSNLGFDIVELSANGNFFEYLAQELRRLPSIVRRHCGSFVGALYVAAHFSLVFPLLAILNWIAKRERGSSGLLCFGYHVIARRLTP
jgi:SAM-dependent methyltransferase